ncbi:MAG TPA: SAM-dependent methyltransferase [Thermoanaerobaculia bacterium]
MADRLHDRIAREGSISFADFMEAALYDPEEGYYGRGASIGEPGDFVTSPHVTPHFAGAVASAFARNVASGEGPVDFVEVAAGEGRFLEDFRQAIADRHGDLSRRLRLTAVEASASAREGLARLSGVRVLAAASDLAPRSVRGWIFSNELFDALPVVRVIGREDGGVDELRVGRLPGGFQWVASPAAPWMAQHLARFGVALEPGQIGEIAPDAAPLYRTLGRALAEGRLVTFDYGHRARSLYHPFSRRGGTLAVHSGGRRGGDPLERPGEVDLTAHVNWDELARAGEEEGLSPARITRQGRWLTEAGILELAQEPREKWRVFRLVDPEGMGDELSVLSQERGSR